MSDFVYGYLENEDSEVAGLTCGHVCGIRLGEQFTSIKMQQPPESSLDKFRQDYPAYSTLYEFPSNSKLDCGYVMDGDIYCKSHRHDWALIKVNLNRLGTNCFPLDPFGNIFGNSVSVQTIELGDQVWKNDIVSEYCSCNINGIMSKELRIVFPKNNRTPFSEPGNSGSFILKMYANGATDVCGMVIAVSSKEGISILTPMEVLLKRINEKTGKKW